MRRLRLACVLGLVFVLGGAGEGAFATGALGFSGYAAARSAGEWPQFHFGPNLKGSNPFETILNPTTVGGLRQAWTLTTGFEIVHSSPAVAGGVAYIGSFDGKLYAADAVTGATLWTFVASDAINSAPAVAGGLVYFTSQGGGKVYALDAATGALRWSARVITDVFSDGLSVADGVVYVDGDSPDLGPVLSAFDAATGVIRWRAPLPSSNDSYPAVAGGRVYVVACGTLFALRATDGSTLWQQAIGGCGNSSPALAGGVVYVGGNSTLYALDAATGSTIWTRTSTTGVVFSTPAVAGDRVFVAMDGSDGEFTVARKAASGAFLWRANAAPRGPAASAIDSSVAVANGVVYMSANDSSLYAYNAKTGALLRRLSLGGQSFSSPAVADGRVYVGALDGKLYAFALP